MQYLSTNHRSAAASFEEAVTSGLAPDGGLYVPDNIPVIPAAVFRNMPIMSQDDIAYLVMETLVGGDIGSQAVRAINGDALNYSLPTRRIGQGVYVTELFHGPSGSGKDLGARFMARLLAHVYRGREKGSVRVIASVSSDSGVAIANAFDGLDPFEAFIVFPRGRISPHVRKAILDSGANIHPVEVRGSTDDCLAMIRTTLVDADLNSKFTLTGVNSINIARLLPTAIQYFTTWAQMVADGADPDNIVMAVPCANLGNFAAALVALKMGLPVKRLIAASNANDAFVRYLATGVYSPTRAVTTSAPSMDVGAPLNMPRVMEMLGGLKTQIEGAAVGDSAIAKTRASLADTYGYTAENHSCVSAAALLGSLKPGEYGAFMATTNHSLTIPEAIPMYCRDTISPTYQALKRIIVATP